ncbi:MAG: hypothetical protein FD137_1717 [Spirochaetes bacterium]|nr:MAG: hypothetical protein FD137_1717 [Spirochaetota bacterium]
MAKMVTMLIAIAAILSFNSCATAASAFDPTIPKIAISKASEADIRSYGRNFFENPYMEPRTLARGKLNEFFILKLDFNLPIKSTVSLIAYAKSPKGEEVAKIYDEKAFKDFWWSNTFRDDDSGVWDRKMTAIEIACIPGFDFDRPAGRTALFVPIVGKNPIPRPANIYAQIALSTGESVEYSFTLE